MHGDPVKEPEYFNLLDVLRQQNLKDTKELVYAHPKQIHTLNDILDHLRIKRNQRIRRHQNVVHNLKNDVLHAREVKHFDNELEAVLD